MGEEFEALLRTMTDEQVNAIDISALDEGARKIVASEAGRRNRENEIAQFDAAQQRGATVSEGNRRWPILALAGAILAVLGLGLIWIFGM